MKSKPGNKAKLIILSNELENNDITLEFLNCWRGEIEIENSCEICKWGTYSLDLDSK